MYGEIKAYRTQSYPLEKTKGSRDVRWIVSTEGRGVGVCWAKSKPNGPEGSRSCSKIPLYLAHKRTPTPKEPLRTQGIGLR